MGWLFAYRRLAHYAAYGAVGVMAVELARQHPESHLLLPTLALMYASMNWCALDARIHGKTFCHGWGLPFMQTLPISWAIHLVWTRGWRRGLKLLGAFLALLFGSMLLYGIVKGTLDFFLHGAPR